MGYEPAKEHTLPTSAKRRNRRPTIGFLTLGVRDANTQALWYGVADGAQKQDVNLICFPGGSLPHLDSVAQANSLYALVTRDNLDGLVSWASAVCVDLNQKDTLSFHQRYDLPMVSLARPIEGFPTLAVDTYEGMREEMIHLVQVHGYRRLAFVRGPEHHPYAQERYRAYMEVLEAYGIPFDPALVTPPGDWTPDFGVKAIRLLLGERHLRPQADFEAVVTVTDAVGVGVLDALLAQGVRVPDQVAVVGFNDMPEGLVVTPPLTSVAMPFHEQGEKAVEALVELIVGRPAPEDIVLPARLVLRQSCGCQSRAVTQAAAGTVTVTSESFEAALATRREDILTEIRQVMGGYAPSKASEWAKQLLDSFAVEMKGVHGTFLFALSETLREAVTAGGDVSAWQGALSALRRHLVSALGGEMLSHAEDVWQQARVVIGEMMQRLEVRRAVRAEQQAQTLREITQALITTFDIRGLMDILAERLPHLGIPSCYLSLYENPQKPTEWSRLMLAYNEKGRIELEAEGWRFPSSQLLPEGLWPDRRFSFVVEPLYFQDDQIGFAVFEAGPHAGHIYDALRGEISSALQGALLVQRVQERSAELARQQYILDTFMGNVPDHIYFKDTQSRFLRISQSMANAFGLAEPAQAVGKSDSDFFSEEHARPAYETEREIIRTGQPVLDVEERETWPDRPDTWVMTSKLPLRDEKGQIIGTFGISRDITEIKRAQQAQEQRARELQAAAEVSRAASSILDANQLIQQTVNLIRDRFDLYYVGLFLLDPDGRYAVLRAGTGEAGRQMVEQGHQLESGATSMIGWCIANRQARIALDVGAEAVRFSNPLLPATRSELALPLISRGRVIGAMTVQSDRAAAFDQDDITTLQTMADQLANAIENARLFEALTREQYLMNAMMNNAPDYIYFKDIHSRFIRTTRSHARAFGLSDPAEVIGRTDFDFFTEEHARPAYEDEQEVIRTGQPVTKEERETWPDRPDTWVLTTKLPLQDNAGKIIGTFGISTDITQRKLAEIRTQETLRELEHLYRITSREGWQAFYKSTQLPSGYLFDHQDTLPVQDVWLPQIEQAIRQNSLVPPATSQEQEESVAVAPLAVRGEVLGAIVVYDDPQQPLSSEDLELVKEITDQGALALESARLFEQTQSARQQAESRLREMEILHRVMRQVSGTLNLGSVLDALVEALSQDLKFSYVACHLIDESANVLRTERAIGLAQPLNGLVRSLDEMQDDILMDIARKRQIEIIDGWDDRLNRDQFEREGHAELVRAYVPLLLRDQAIGILETAYRRGERTDLSQEEINLLRSLADQMAVAVQNTHLYEQTQARARREQILREVTARVRRSTDPDTVMRTLARELGTVLGRPAFVRLGSPEEFSRAPVTQSARGNGDQPPGGDLGPDAEGGK